MCALSFVLILFVILILSFVCFGFPFSSFVFLLFYCFLSCFFFFPLRDREDIKLNGLEDRKDLGRFGEGKCD